MAKPEYKDENPTGQPASEEVATAIGEANGIYDRNPKVARVAREKSKKKQVIVLERGYYGERIREEGEIFEVPVAEKADWFEDVKSSGKITNADEELV